MQKLVTQPYAAEDGREFVGYMQRILDETTRLQAEGRVPDDDGVDDVLTFWRAVTAQINADLGNAGTASRQPITSAVPMTQDVHQRTWAVLDTLYPLLRIIEMRGAIDLTRTEGVTRVVDAIHRGALTAAD
ncbi:MAG TPA: hypothetical protein VHB18_12130 [Mycobacteriales bacterium]|jgi:hypothetical protein|nr:hypothetical protein [Mycobacteriales bacterium]